ncbi:MAG: hypothetical protein ACW98X_20250 [Promethearchaeota archaeon]|jgi:hypothetical protein
MGKNRKEKSKQINMPRISPMDDVKYFQEIVSWALAMHHINYIKENGIE